MLKVSLHHASLLGCLSLLLSCQPHSANLEIINFEDSDNCKALSQFVKSVEFIPLNSDGDHLLGFRHDLYHANDGTYIISDSNNGSIYRYSSCGEYLNEIGHKGNGPAEYQSIQNIQVVSNIVYVYSNSGRRLSYTLAGDFLELDKYDDLGTQTYTTEKGVLTYFGYGSGRGHRFGLYNGGSAIEYQIPSLENVINLTSNFPIFSEYNGKVFVADSYNESVMMFLSGQVQPYCQFNFGKYAIQNDFFSFDNPMDAMQSLMSRSFAMIHSYQESDTYCYIEVNIQGGSMPRRSYGLKYKDTWHWFSLGTLDKDPLAGQVYLLENDVLYCMMDPALVGNLQNEILRKATNPEALNGLSVNSNYVIAKIELL